MGAASGPRMTLGHMGIGCFDLDLMIDFYTRVLGFTITDRNGERNVFMTTDPAEHHLMVLVRGRNEGEVIKGPAPGGSVGTAIFQISYRIDSLDTLRALKKRVEDYGIGDLVLRNHGNAWAVYFRDPEGNAIELYVPTPWHATQPLGQPLDLEQSDEEIYALTESLCKARPDYQTYDAWREAMSKTIEDVQSRI